MRVRKISISVKIIIAMAIILLLSDAILGVVLYNRSKSAMMEQIRTNAMNVAQCAAASVDGNAISKVQSGDDGSSSDYQAVLEALTLFLENGGVEYVYTVRKEDGKNIFVVDSDPEEPGMPGDDFEDDSEEIDSAYAGNTVAGAPYTDEWGTHISAYSPIYADNSVVALAVVDVSVAYANQKTTALLITIIIVCVILFAVGIFISLALGLSIRRGFGSLNQKVVDLTDGSGDLRKEIEIHSGDELEVIAVT